VFIRPYKTISTENKREGDTHKPTQPNQHKETTSYTI